MVLRLATLYKAPNTARMLTGPMIFRRAAWSVLAWSQVNSQLALTLTLTICLGEAELGGATAIWGLLLCVLEPRSREFHHGATAVASLDTLTSSVRLSTSKSGLNTIWKSKERKKFIKQKFNTNGLYASEQTESHL